jgi:hypothetical protein
VSDDANIPKRSGTFSISPSRAIYGELTLTGRSTLLYLRDNEHFNIYTIPDQCILGTLYDLKKNFIDRLLYSRARFGRYWR